MTRFAPPLRTGLVALAVTALSCSSDTGNSLDTFGTDGTDGGAGASGGTGGSPGSGGNDGDSTGGADSDTTGPGGYSCNRENAWYVEFAEDHCGRCHGNTPDPKGGFDHVLDVDRMLVSGRIVAGEPESSPMYLKMATGAMPPPQEMPRPSDEQVERVAEMIRRCTANDGPEADDCIDQEYVPYDAQLAAMLQDLTSLPAGDYPFIRYLTFTHLHNVGVCGQEFDDYRTGLAKLVNSLSDQNQIVPPVAIDTERSIYRIDLRDYGWDVPAGGFPDRWEAAVDANAYAVLRFEDDAVTLQTLTQTQFPFLRADAFVDDASQPPLYPVMLGLPNNLAGLEDQLLLDIADDIADQTAARAGVLVSGVATRNRVLQRHAIQNGAFWRTFEFDDDSQGPQNILASPLDFEERGGSVIFSLPNRLHGYMVLNANGARIDEAPIELMIDPASDGGRVRTGLSCFGCHTEVVSAADSVREFVLSGADFNADDQADVSALYPPADEFDSLVSDDTNAYRQALVDAGVNPDAPEPINATVFGFVEAPITLEQAAAELGIEPSVLESKLAALNPALESLRDGGTIGRNTWEGLFAETICGLNLGEPLDGGC